MTDKNKSLSKLTAPSLVNVSQSWGRRVLRLAFSGKGARIGLAWVALLTLTAVFAPFLANSMPLLVSQQGTVSSPVLHSLTVEDVIVLASFFIIIISFLFSLTVWQRVATILLGVLLSSVLANIFITPPGISIYEQHRESMSQQQYDWAIFPPIPYAAQDYLRDFGETSLESPLSDEAETEQRTHWMGTDENGADVLSRMIHASRIALGIGFVATGIAMFIGIIIGGLMGYFSGWVDMLGMRLVEIFEAIPVLFLLLTFVAFFGRSIYIMMIIIGVTSWTGYARFVRAEFLKLRQQDYVQAAIACGLPLRSVLFKHMLPNGLAPILVSASFGVASAILAEATLSFLGLGLIGDPSWGQMLNQAVQSSNFNWWMAVFPGGAIFMTVFAYNLMGEALRDAIDPQLARRR